MLQYRQDAGGAWSRGCIFYAKVGAEQTFAFQQVFSRIEGDAPWSAEAGEKHGELFLSLRSRPQD